MDIEPDASKAIPPVSALATEKLFDSTQLSHIVKLGKKIDHFRADRFQAPKILELNQEQPKPNYIFYLREVKPNNVGDKFECLFLCPTNDRIDFANFKNQEIINVVRIEIGTEGAENKLGYRRTYFTIPGSVVNSIPQESQDLLRLASRWYPDGIENTSMKKIVEDDAFNSDEVERVLDTYVKQEEKASLQRTLGRIKKELFSGKEVKIAGVAAIGLAVIAAREPIFQGAQALSGQVAGTAQQIQKEVDEFRKGWESEGNIKISNPIGQDIPVTPSPEKPTLPRSLPSSDARLDGLVGQEASHELHNFIPNSLYRMQDGVGKFTGYTYTDSEFGGGKKRRDEYIYIKEENTPTVMRLGTLGQGNIPIIEIIPSKILRTTLQQDKDKTRQPTVTLGYEDNRVNAISNVTTLFSTILPPGYDLSEFAKIIILEKPADSDANAAVIPIGSGDKPDLLLALYVKRGDVEKLKMNYKIVNMLAGYMNDDTSSNVLNIRFEHVDDTDYVPPVIRKYLLPTFPSLPTPESKNSPESNPWTCTDADLEKLLEIALPKDSKGQYETAQIKTTQSFGSNPASDLGNMTIFQIGEGENTIYKLVFKPPGNQNKPFTVLGTIHNESYAKEIDLSKLKIDNDQNSDISIYIFPYALWTTNLNSDRLDLCNNIIHTVPSDENKTTNDLTIGNTDGIHKMLLGIK